jgi:hypothetical protein
MTPTEYKAVAAVTRPQAHVGEGEIPVDGAMDPGFPKCLQSKFHPLYHLVDRRLNELYWNQGLRNAKIELQQVSDEPENVVLAILMHYDECYRGW